MNYSFLPSSAQRFGVRRASLWSVVVIAAQRLFEQIAHRRVIRRDLNRLMEFDDRPLADIGTQSRRPAAPRSLRAVAES